MEKFLITNQGYQKLKNEIAQLKNIERPASIKAIATARELGDISENADYHAAREKQGMIEARIAYLEDKFARAQVIDIDDMKGDAVRFGAVVELKDSDRNKLVSYQIVSEYEADIDSGLISYNSPVAKALMGRETGDEVEIRAPGGVINYEIMKVSFS